MASPPVLANGYSGFLFIYRYLCQLILMTLWGFVYLFVLVKFKMLWCHRSDFQCDRLSRDLKAWFSKAWKVEVCSIGTLYVVFSFLLQSLQLSHFMLVREPMRKEWKKDKHRTRIYLLMQSNIDFVILWVQQFLKLCQYLFQLTGAERSNESLNNKLNNG